MLESQTLVKSVMKGQPCSPVLQVLAPGDSIAVCGECKGVLFAVHIMPGDVTTHALVCLNCKTKHQPMICVPDDDGYDDVA